MESEDILPIKYVHPGLNRMYVRIENYKFKYEWCSYYTAINDYRVVRNTRRLSLDNDSCMLLAVF